MASEVLVSKETVDDVGNAWHGVEIVFGDNVEEAHINCETVECCDKVCILGIIHVLDSFVTEVRHELLYAFDVLHEHDGIAEV